ncbi:unnamed protein product [Calicophoron daubneyi]|uniref:Axin-1 n=1 Tax=Calicophoron daubneyi TaxID=300641 RepID=A0AAV2TIU1_CALDB
MSYPPEASRSCHEADGRSDRSGGSGGGGTASGSSGGVYGTVFGGKWITPGVRGSEQRFCNPLHAPTSAHDRLISNWKKWSLGLDYLLQDSEGVALFKSYLQYESCSNLLDFWFACQGFRSKVDPSDHRKIAQLIKAIYRTYIRGSGCSNMGLPSGHLPGMIGESQSPVGLFQPRAEPIRLRAETRRMIAERISHKHSLDQTVFDPAQAEVEHFLRTTAYPAFLKSDVYVDFLQTALDGSRRLFQTAQMDPNRQTSSGWSAMDTGNITQSLGECQPNFTLPGKILPTLDEDRELKSEELARHGVPLSRRRCEVGTFSGPPMPPQPLQQFQCQYCSQYHLQGHPNPCPSIDPSVTSYSHPTQSVALRPALCCSSVAAAPLTMENLQMTRFYRAELSLQQGFTNPTAGTGMARPQLLQECPPSGNLRRTCDPMTGFARSHGSYVHTHWADAICPPAPQPTGNRLPSQPPNPYHISYAPVSARDSERHSLSSEARTDDAHSHTDSSHHRYPSQPRGQNQTVSQTRSDRRHTQLGVSAVGNTCVTTLTSPTTFAPSKPALPIGGGPSAPGFDETGGGGGHGEREHSRPHARHQRRAARRGLPGWRSTERGKSVGAEPVSDEQQNPAPPNPKSIVRSHNLAERDPPAFFRLLSDKLQRVLDNQIATERLDRLMTETSPNPPQSTTDTTQQEATLSPSASNQTVGISVNSSGATHPVSADRCSGATVQSVLQRPWADRLLAAARVQHENSRDNAQAILEDHCSRIWAASADRTPTSSGSGSGGNPLVGDMGNASNGGHPVEYSDQGQVVDPNTNFPPAFDASSPRTRLSPELATSHISRPAYQLSSASADHLHPHQREQNRYVQSVVLAQPSFNLPPPLSSSCVSQSSAQHLPLSAVSNTKENPADHSVVAGTTVLPLLKNIVGKTRSPYSESELQFSPPDDLVLSIRARTAPLSPSCETDDKFSEHKPKLIKAHSAEQSAISPPSSTSSNDNCVARIKRPGPSAPERMEMPAFSANHGESPERPIVTTACTALHSASSSTTSAVSTSTPGLPASSSSSGSPTSLVIGYYLGDDPVPYRSLWPSSEITLGQFKQLIPRKKGTFRYFFKKLSNEFGSGVVHQEITNDNCILPLWEGKVVAKVERIE